MNELRAVSSVTIERDTASNFRSLLASQSKIEHDAIQVIPNNRRILVQFLRMTLSIIIPIVFLVVFTNLTYNVAKEKNDEANLASNKVDIHISLEAVVSSMQRERGMTAGYLSSGGENKAAYVQVVAERQITDKALNSLLSWDKTFKVYNRIFPTLVEFKDFLTERRINFDMLLFKKENAVDFYTSVIYRFVSWEIRVANHFKVIKSERQLNAINSITLATEHLGLQRGIGTGFYVHCSFSDEYQKLFTELEGGANAYFTLTSLNDVEWDYYYLKATKKISHNFAIYQEYKSWVWNRTAQKMCLNLNDSQKFDNSIWWFYNATIYINSVNDIRKVLREKLIIFINDSKRKTKREMILYLSVMVLVVVGCSMLSMWNFSSIYNMTKKIKKFTQQLSFKTDQLRRERRRANDLLCEMLPPQIARKLLSDDDVDPEYFESVTIYFSDVVNFTEFCSTISPFIIVDFLNGLYGLFDNYIEKYDVYKVETVGDAYMVVSGLPQRNGLRHVVEISTFALDVLKAVTSFSLPQIPGKKFQIRIGIHTGPCVAGVVGTKMPHYCLFGDTVNTASRMESTGDAQQIQVSETSFKVLENIGVYSLELRGEINIKGKGLMKTYWLRGKQNTRSK